MTKPIISADSHITEPPGTYVDRIDRKFKDRAPIISGSQSTATRIPSVISVFVVVVTCPSHESIG